MARWARAGLAWALALWLCEALVEAYVVQLLHSEAPKVAKNTLAFVVFGLSILLVWQEKRLAEFLTAADVAIVALGVVLLLSAVANRIELDLTGKALYVYLRGAIAFYAVRALVPTNAWRARMLWIGGGWAALNSVVAVAQVAIGPRAYAALGWDDLTAAEIHRGQGFFAHPNDLGHLLGLSLLVAFAFPVTKKWIWLGVLGAGLAATQSRESLLAVMAGLAIIGTSRRIGWRKLGAIGGTVAVLAVVPLVAIEGVRAEVARRAAGVASALGVTGLETQQQDPNLPVCERPAPPPDRQRPGSPCRRPEPEQEIRIVYARQGLRLLTDRPALGYGPGTFGGIVAVAHDPMWSANPRFGTEGFDMQGFHGKTVDSFWLHLLVETGILGVLAYLAWLAMLGRSAAGIAMTAFAAIVAIFSPALEGPLVPPLLFAALGVLYRHDAGRTGYPLIMKTTWKAPDRQRHGDLTSRSDLPDEIFAFPNKRKEPLTDADHVRNALARFDQVEDVTDAERDQAFANIVKAAKHYDVEIKETDWHQLGKRPHTENPAQ